MSISIEVKKTKFSIIIPVKNETKAIGLLLDSLQKIDYPSDNYEIIVVNDASSDNTLDVIMQYKKVKVIDLKINEGRYNARISGALHSKHNNLIFIDSRCICFANMLNRLDVWLKQKNDVDVVIGHIKQPEKENKFDVIYRCIRERVFQNFFANLNQDIELNKANFDKFPKGTTICFIRKDVLINYHEKKGNQFDKNASDDTKLFYGLLTEKHKIIISPALQVINYAREGFATSIAHLFKRGYKFVDYYFSFKKLRYGYLFFVPIIFVISVIVLWLYLPVGLLILAMLLWGLILALFGKTLREKFIVAYMFPLVAVIFYLGIFRGIIYKFLKI